eukprot:jgi/Tetstr1/425871/TSEL_016246.t1
MSAWKQVLPIGLGKSNLHLVVTLLLLLLAGEQYFLPLSRRNRQQRQPNGGAQLGTKTARSSRLSKPRMNKPEPPPAHLPSWKVKLCHVKGRPEGKPGLQGLPVTLPIKTKVDDVFVHRKNFIQLHMEDVINNINLLYPNSSDIVRRYSWQSCAIVGNSGGLRLSKFGEAINSHNVVLRTNQAPCDGYRPYVGGKTTFRMLNNLWTLRYINYKEVMKQRAAENPQMPLEKGLTLLLTRVTGAQFDEMAQTLLRLGRRDVRMLLLSSRVVSAARRLLAGYRDRLCKAGYGPYQGGSTPSSGFVSVYLLLQLCQKVTLYGFGSKDDNGKNLKYHYYHGFGARKFGTVREDGSPVHSWETEAEVLDALSRHDRITICRAAKSNSTASRRHNHECGMYHPPSAGEPPVAVPLEPLEEGTAEK